MSSGNWLSLLQYSTKHEVSLSTLRRRIKNNSVTYRMEHGKYLILDEDPEKVELVNAVPPVPLAQAPVQFQNHLGSGFVEESIFTAANRLVEELKAAYAKVLQEKEEQITLLKEEIVDLRMLVKILEEQKTAKQDQSFFTDRPLREV